MTAPLAAPFTDTSIAELAQAIARDFLPVFVARGDEKEYVYKDPRTERDFMVRVSFGFVNDSDKEVERFFLEELSPNGRMAVPGAGGHDSYVTEPLILHFEKKQGPNAFLAAIRDAGIDPDALCFTGSGYSVTGIYLSSLQECAEAIAHSLGSNTRYVAHRELTEQEETRLARKQEEGRHAYYAGEKALIEQAQSLPGFFKGMTTMLAPLPEQSQMDILSYLNAPAQELWNKVRSLNIAGHRTLWQAWTKYDASAPTTGSEGFPSREVLLKAMEKAVKDHAADVEQRLADSSPFGLRVVK